MILGKKDSLVGLDIGSRSVKVAEITETKNGRKLRRFGMADIPPGAIICLLALVGLMTTGNYKNN